MLSYFYFNKENKSHYLLSLAFINLKKRSNNRNTCFSHFNIKIILDKINLQSTTSLTYDLFKSLTNFFIFFKKFFFLSKNFVCLCKPENQVRTFKTRKDFKTIIIISFIKK
jgi:hypothetical protein